MTNKDFFLKIIKEETPKFRKAIEALAEDMHGHKVHEKSREAGNLAGQLAIQWKGISGIINNGAPDFDVHAMGLQTKAQMLENYDEGMAQLQKDMEVISEEEWLNGDAGWGEGWKDKKYTMAWGFFFDAVHHRGQLTTYLRAMGAIVPSIYGPSADMEN